MNKHTDYWLLALCLVISVAMIVAGILLRDAVAILVLGSAGVYGIIEGVSMLRFNDRVRRDHR